MMSYPMMYMMYCIVRWLSISNVLVQIFLINQSNQTIYGRKKILPLQEEKNVFMIRSRLYLVFIASWNFLGKTFKLKHLHFNCLKKISESLPNIWAETEDYSSKMSGLAEEINDRFHGLKSLKP